MRLNRIQRELSAAAGIVQWPQVGERLYSRVQLARDRLGAEQVAAVEAERRESTLDAALELVEAGRSDERRVGEGVDPVTFRPSVLAVPH